MKRKNKCGIAGCISTVFLFTSVVTADVVKVTGNYTGTTGAYAQNGAINYGFGVWLGNTGGDGYDVTSSTSSYVFSNATILGGAGGAVGASTNSPGGGSGGNGLGIGTSTAVMINSGSYTGGVGGSSPYANGYPGSALVSGGNVNIYGGTFTGGAGTPGKVPGGDAYDIDGGVDNIYGGTFTGGADDLGTEAGAALKIYTGTANIYGGTFTDDGTIAALQIGNASAAVNIYGSNFSVNGVPVGYGPVSATSGTLTGLLEDNTAAS